jgi:hypothetical protein
VLIDPAMASRPRTMRCCRCSTRRRCPIRSC